MLARISLVMGERKKLERTYLKGVADFSHLGPQIRYFVINFTIYISIQFPE